MKFGKSEKGEKVEHVDADVISAEPPADVWGDLSGEGPNYRGLGWVRSSIVMIKIQVGLGVLAIPANLVVFGFAPGMIIIFVIGVFISWTDWVVGMFKLAHPSVYTIADVGPIIGGPVVGPILGIILGIMYWLYLTFIAGAGLLGSATAFNAVSEHGTCTVVFVLVSAIIVFMIASIQTLDRLSWITWFGITCLMAGILTVTIAVGVEGRPNGVPAGDAFDPGVVAAASPNFKDASAAISSIIFSFAGTPGFFPIVSEMRDYTKYTRSLILCQAFVIATYMVVGGVLYHYAGAYVASPALGTAGPLLKKISYGLALPGLLVGAVLNSHLPAKFLFQRLLGGTEHLTKNTKKHYIVWYSCVFLNVAVSFVIAEAIPVFSDLLSLIGAALATPLSLTVEGFMFIFEDVRLKRRMTFGRILLHAFNALVIILSFYFLGSGWYASVQQIIDSVDNGNTAQPFSCADNSNSV